MSIDNFTPHIYIAVNSHKNFSPKTLPVLIPSLLACGVPRDRIVVFEGGHNKSAVTQYQFYLKVQCTHNSIDFTALLELADRDDIRSKAEYWFLIHDTCKVGSSFWKLICDMGEHHRPEKMALRPRPSMNIGAYRSDYIVKHREYLQKTRNDSFDRDIVQEFKKWGQIGEDYLLHKQEDCIAPTYHPELYIGKEGGMTINPNDDWYNSTGIVRRTEYYPNLDLYKSKANWGGKPWMEIDV